MEHCCPHTTPKVANVILREGKGDKILRLDGVCASFARKKKIGKLNRTEKMVAESVKIFVRDVFILLTKIDKIFYKYPFTKICQSA